MPIITSKTMIEPNAYPYGYVLDTPALISPEWIAQLDSPPFEKKITTVLYNTRTHLEKRIHTLPCQQNNNQDAQLAPNDEKSYLLLHAGKLRAVTLDDEAKDVELALGDDIAFVKKIAENKILTMHHQKSSTASEEKQEKTLFKIHDISDLSKPQCLKELSAPLILKHPLQIMADKDSVYVTTRFSIYYFNSFTSTDVTHKDMALAAEEMISNFVALPNDEFALTTSAGKMYLLNKELTVINQALLYRTPDSWPRIRLTLDKQHLIIYNCRASANGEIQIWDLEKKECVEVTALQRLVNGHVTACFIESLEIINSNLAFAKLRATSKYDSSYIAFIDLASIQSLKPKVVEASQMMFNRGQATNTPEATIVATPSTNP